jgi:hypothetical protein
MKCSDCKYFKTAECKLKPVGEVFIGARLDCFELNSSIFSSGEKQAAVPWVPKDMGAQSRETISHILLIVGIVGIILSITSLGIACSFIPEPDGLPYCLIGVPGFIISLLILVWGWAFRRGSVSEKKNQSTGSDLKSGDDNNPEKP